MNKIQSYAHTAARSGPESTAGPPPPAHGGDRSGPRVVRRPAAAGPGRRSKQAPSRPPARPRRPTAAIEAGPESSAVPPPPAHGGDRSRPRVVRRPAAAGPRRRGPSCPLAPSSRCWSLGGSAPHDHWPHPPRPQLRSQTAHHLRFLDSLTYAKLILERFYFFLPCPRHFFFFSELLGSCFLFGRRLTLPRGFAPPCPAP